VGTIEKTKRIYRFQGFNFNRINDFDLFDFSSLSFAYVISNKKEKGD